MNFVGLNKPVALLVSHFALQKVPVFDLRFGQGPAIGRALLSHSSGLQIAVIAYPGRAWK
jgi:hypothetical protein